ncbi:MAG: hypothetical protein HYZ75_18785 [Elusimicrobia bacterium]|nr:hypothetical protein [Elusimicrobiota bacterium]
MNATKSLALAAALLTGTAAAAWALDSAALQFTVPAPDPVQAGESVALQALAVNTGDAAWAAGTYYWIGEVYDLDEKLVGRTEQVSPRETVAAGAVASVSLSFHVPDTAIGRRLYRVLLIKDSQTLIASPLKPFVIIEKAVPEPPKNVDYKVQGNVTVSYRNSSRDGWNRHSGATTINGVGKLKDSSYLLNAYILHEKGKVFDPFTVLFTLYAPWGTIFGGDISPQLSELSVNGQSARGAMLEQRRGEWEWTVLGGMTVDSQAGTATTNGRFARSLYAGKLGRRLFGKVTTAVNYFLSADESQSLSTDPKSPTFRGPTLVPQKNSGYGLSLAYDPFHKVKLLFDWQKTTFAADTAKPGVKDGAWRGELRWERPLFKLKTFVSRAGPKFVSFGAPSSIGDRLTYDASLGFYPVSWNSMSLAINQYRDNLANDRLKTSTTQRFISVSDSLQLKTQTSISLSGALVTAKGKPETVLDNQTTTIGAAVSQRFGRNSVAASLNTSRFKDKNRLAHDLDTNTMSVASTWGISPVMSASFGVSRSATKDKVDGSQRTSLSVSPSVSRRLNKIWTSQVWGTLTQTKNTAPLFPSDVRNTQLNTEFTYAKSQALNMTLGAGYNKNDDKLAPGNKFSEILASTRVSWSF